MDNLMKGIKANEMLTKILAAKITNQTNKLQERFQKMTAIYGEQFGKVTICRTVSWQVAFVNSVITDRENISLAHSSKGNEEDAQFCSRTLNTFRVSSFKTNTPILL